MCQQAREPVAMRMLVSLPWGPGPPPGPQKLAVLSDLWQWICLFSFPGPQSLGLHSPDLSPVPAALGDTGLTAWVLETAKYKLLLCQVLAVGTWASDLTSLRLSLGSEPQEAVVMEK